MPGFVKKMDEPAPNEHEMTTSGIFQIRQKIEEKSKRPIKLNVLVAGEEKVGKTALINTILNYVHW